MRDGRARRRGFTLIELLVVIVVISILAAILLPVMHKAQAKAREAQCLSNLSAVAVAMKLYRQEYKRFPLGSLSGNVDGLPDDQNRAAYTSTSYDTANGGAKSRINALFPSYLENQRSLICPDEDQSTDLNHGSVGATSINGGDPKTLLEVGGDPNGSVSTYDAYYNVFGYCGPSDAAYGANGGVQLGFGTPIVTVARMQGGGRKAARLSNPYAPGSTIITYCRKHEENYDAANPAADPGGSVVMAVRVDGHAERIVRATFAWATQAEQVYQ